MTRLATHAVVTICASAAILTQLNELATALHGWGR